MATNTRSTRKASKAKSKPPKSNKANTRLEAEKARLQRKLRHQYDRSHHSKHDSSDSEVGDGPMVSFLHHAGNKPFLRLIDHYPAVNIKYFKQIFWGTFQPRDSMKLTHDALAWSITPRVKRKDDVLHESSDIIQLLRAFEVYGHAICFFAARPHVALELHEALRQYRLRLMEFSITFSFESIRTYHYSFMAKRILRRQDDPIAWLSEDQQCYHYLEPSQQQCLAPLQAQDDSQDDSEDRAPTLPVEQDDSQDDTEPD